MAKPLVYNVLRVWLLSGGISKLEQLKEALALERDRGKKLQHSFSRIEEELLKEERKVKDNEAKLAQLRQLQDQVDYSTMNEALTGSSLHIVSCILFLVWQLGEKKGQVASLERDNAAMTQEFLNLRTRNSNLEARIVCLDKEAADHAVSMADMQHLVNEKTRICEEKMLESSLLGSEVQSWVEGNEKLLAEQEKLVLEVLHVRDLLAQNGSEKQEAAHALQKLILQKDKMNHALALGVVHLARAAQAKPRIIWTASMVRREKTRTDQHVDKSVSCTSSSIFHDMLDPSDEEVFRLRDHLHRIEGSTKEESDKRSWLEKQTGDVWKQLSKQKSELSDADQRVANLASEKRTVDHLLNLAEDEIRRLRERITELRIANDEQSRQIEVLKSSALETASQQAENSAEILDLRASLAEQLEAKALSEKLAADLKDQVNYLEWCLRDMTENYNKTLEKEKKWKELAEENANIIAQLRAQLLELRAKYDGLQVKYRELDYMLKDEQKLREEAEKNLKEVLAQIDSLKLEIKGLERLLKTAEAEKTAITRRVTHLNVENDHLKEERTREVIIREILQNEVDALRLLTESLKMKLSASRRQAENQIAAREGTLAEDRGLEKAREIDEEVLKLESKIEALLTTRVAEVQKLQTDIQRRLLREEAEMKHKQEDNVSSLGAETE